MKTNSKSDKALLAVVYVTLILVIVAMIFPFWDQVVLSLSTREQALRGGVRLFPWPLDFTAYEKVLSSPELWKAFRFTVLRVVVGTIWGLFITAMTAYPLSRDEFPLRGLWMSMIVLTMLFSGGLIPEYLLRKELHLIDNPLVLILPGLTAFNIIIMRNFFKSLPPEMTEAAQLDGASDFRIFWNIVLPLSKPILATIGLFLAVYHWNAYFDALIYITDRDKYVLQVILRRILLEGQTDMFVQGMAKTVVGQEPTAETVKAALVIVTTIPILLIYPLLQRHFIKGTLLGAVKD